MEDPLEGRPLGGFHSLAFEGLPVAAVILLKADGDVLAVVSGRNLDLQK